MDSPLFKGCCSLTRGCDGVSVDVFLHFSFPAAQELPASHKHVERCWCVISSQARKQKSSQCPQPWGPGLCLLLALRTAIPISETPRTWLQTKEVHKGLPPSSEGWEFVEGAGDGPSLRSACQGSEGPKPEPQNHPPSPDSLQTSHLWFMGGFHLSVRWGEPLSLLPFSSGKRGSDP